MAYVYYQPNPVGRNVGDCSIRAVAKALDIDWEGAYALVVANGFQMGDVPSSDAVWGSVLRQFGFYREVVSNSCPDCYTAADFARDHPRGTFVLGFGGHVATMKDGDLFDSWDSTGLSPQYYWYRKDDK
jgi:hypothetical protein